MRAEPLGKSYLTVEGKYMAFHERGEGHPIVFLHGNPTSSYLWRNVIPHVEDQGRCIAVDLLGFGDSDKLGESGPDSYTYVEHRGYLDGLLDQLDLGDRITFVLHDWGSALGFDWASRHGERVVGVAYMEAIAKPCAWDDWTWPEGAEDIFTALRSRQGEHLILEHNTFVEVVIPAGCIRDLSAEEMAEYRRPFAEPGEDRRPTLTWPRQMPLGGEPAEVAEIVERSGQWMTQAPMPKLFINGDPGLILTGQPREFCRSWPNQTEVTVTGLHYLQEDSPEQIGEALSRWLAGEVDEHVSRQGRAAGPPGAEVAN
jgi:haloalkane dehalogenase